MTYLCFSLILIFLFQQQDHESKAAMKRQDEVRLLNNRKQPEDLPRFTEVGFKKVTVPDDVWEIVKTYYEGNK